MVAAVGAQWVYRMVAVKTHFSSGIYFSKNLSAIQIKVASFGSVCICSGPLLIVHAEDGDAWMAAVIFVIQYYTVRVLIACVPATPASIFSDVPNLDKSWALNNAIDRKI